MTSPQLNLNLLDATPIAAGTSTDTAKAAIAARVFRDLQANKLIPADARLTDSSPAGDQTYHAQLKGLVDDRNGNGRLDIDTDALRNSGLLTGQPSNKTIESALRGASPKDLDDKFLTAQGGEWTTWGCVTGVSPRGRDAQRLTKGMAFDSDLDARATASPEEAQKLAKSAVAGAQFLSNRNPPQREESFDVLRRSGDALFRADRLTEAKTVAGELRRLGATAEGDERLAAIDQRLNYLSPEEKASLGPEGRKLDESVSTWIDRSIADQQATIERKKAANGDPQSYQANVDRVAELSLRRQEIVRELRDGSSQGDDLVKLAGVVQNEAGKCSPDAKNSVAYAWLNRTGGQVRDPIDDPGKNEEISNYRSLQERWDTTSDVGKITLLKQLPESLHAADIRLSDPEAKANDPTSGATHWVSPIGLEKYNPKSATHRSERYSRDIGSVTNAAFPNWAKEPGPNAPLATDWEGNKVGYSEITAPNVSVDEFLFFRGVTYKKVPLPEPSAVRP